MVTATQAQSTHHNMNPLRKLLKSRSRKKTAKDNGINNNNLKTKSKIPSQTNEETSKMTLFFFPESEISQYKLDSDELDLHIILQKFKPSVLTQGKFKVYSINSAFNYFNCGSLTHPVLAFSKFIKITPNTYIIPIKNPVRYWKLSLNTEDEAIINDFENVLRKIAKLSSNMVSDFTLSSPFTTFIGSDSITTVSDPSSPTLNNSLILHHPVPVRPHTSSTISIRSNSVINIDDSSLSTTYSNAEKINYFLNVSVSDDLTLANVVENPDHDLDHDLNGNCDLKEEVINTDDDAFTIDIDFEILLNEDLDNELDDDLSNDVQLERSYDDLLQLWNNTDLLLNEESHLSNRYSLSFKTYDTTKPIPVDVIDKYKDSMKSLVITSKSNTGLFDKFMGNL